MSNGIPPAPPPPPPGARLSFQAWTPTHLSWARPSSRSWTSPITIPLLAPPPPPPRQADRKYAASMAAVSDVLKTTALATAGCSALALGYASGIERNAFVVREVTMPVLSPGSTPLRVLHISDIHMRPGQRLKQAWLRELASLQPDLVVNTGDNLAHPKAVPAVVQALGDLLAVPGVFVFGSNDYFAPMMKNPANYLFAKRPSRPWQPAAMARPARGVHRTGWLDLTHARRELDVAGLTIAAAGVDDPHLERDRYDTIAGPANRAANLTSAWPTPPTPGSSTDSPTMAINW